MKCPRCGKKITAKDIMDTILRRVDEEERNSAIITRFPSSEKEYLKLIESLKNH